MPKIVISDWSMGLWTAGPPAKNPPRTCTRGTNIQFLDEGTVQTRYGCSKIFDLADTTDGTLISGLHFFKDSAGTVYGDSATSLGFTQTGRRLRVAAMSTTGLLDDMVFFPTCMKKVFQNTVYNWGINDTPTAPTGTVTGGIGNLTGNYSYHLDFYDSVTLEFSHLSSASVTVTALNDKIILSGLPTTAPAGVDTVRIYRNKAASSTVFYSLTSVALGTASYTDNTADAGLGNAYAPSVANIPVGHVPVLGAAGALTGDYSYRIVFYSTTTGNFSESSPVSAVVSPIAQEINLTNIPVVCTDMTVDAVNIYRTKGAVSGVWYYVDQVALAAGSYLDNIPDALLGSPLEPTIARVPNKPTLTLSSGMYNLTGDYTYRLVFYNSVTHTFSAISPISATLTVTQGGIILSNIPTTTTDPQVDTVKIYRSQGGIAGAWYYVDEVALGVDTYADNVADEGLGDAIDFTIVPPPSCNVANKYKNRMLLLDLTSAPRNVWASLPSQPESFSNLIYELLMDAGDTAEAVLEMGDYAMVFGRRGIYSVQIDNTGIIYTARVVSGKGTVNGRTISMGDLGIYFLSDDGVYILSGFNVYKMSDNIDALFRNTDRGGMSIIADYDKTGGNFVGGRYYLYYYGADAQWHMVSYNERKQRWRHFTGWRWVSLPDEGAYPYVGLPNSISHYDPDRDTEDGSLFYSEVGFNLPTSITALMDIRTFRISLECAGTVTIEFWDDDTLKYSVDLDNYTFDDAYLKHSLPLGTYFLQPEVRVSCPDQPFVLKLFEADVDYVRKYEADYTRSFAGAGNSGAAGNSA